MILVGNSVLEEEGLSDLVMLLPELVDNLYLSWKFSVPKDFYDRPVCQKGYFLLEHDEPQCLSASSALYMLFKRLDILDERYSYWPVHQFFSYLGPHVLLEIVNNETKMKWYLDITLQQFNPTFPKILFGDIEDYRIFYNNVFDKRAGDEIAKELLKVIPNYRHEFLTFSDYIGDIYNNLFK